METVRPHDELQRLHDPRLKSFAELGHVGIAIQTAFGDEEQRHLGAIYKAETQQEVLLLHLCGQGKVRIRTERAESSGAQPCFWVEPRLPARRLRAMSRLCARVSSFYGARNGKGISFAIRYTESDFNEQGEYRPGPDRGLTCATFVLALFKSRGMPLLRQDEWSRRPEDEKWQQGAVEFRELEEEPDGIRFRPEEVTASGLVEQLPLGFEDAERLGHKIVERLTNWSLP